MNPLRIMLRGLEAVNTPLLALGRIMLIWFLPVFLVLLMIGLPVFFALLEAPGALLFLNGQERNLTLL